MMLGMGEVNFESGIFEILDEKEYVFNKYVKETDSIELLYVLGKELSEEQKLMLELEYNANVTRDADKMRELEIKLKNLN